MEELVAEFWRGRRVFLTGHTGFKGSWLSLWLQLMGAELTGYALAPPTDPSLFEAARVAVEMTSHTGDLADLPGMRAHFERAAPEIVFHLAAQPLVRASYADPLGTFQTNVMGTANLLECVRQSKSVRAVVVITTDKCYENREWPWAYRETDTLGGHDPYSSSKACAEIVAASYRSAFFVPGQAGSEGVALATARAGNVIGGGDWASDRLIADIMRAFTAGAPVRIRSPHATRPWQHVLEPLRGYLVLAQALAGRGTPFAQAWNFGPHYADARPVQWIADRLASAWGDGARSTLDDGPHPHETHTLKVDWSKAAAMLGWEPLLRLTEALEMTSHWYRSVAGGADARALTVEQIRSYSARAGAPLLLTERAGTVG